MENRYYHGVTGGLPFWCTKSDEVLAESLKKLELIFKYQAIYCRRLLDEHEINLGSYKPDQINYNGYDFISVCMSNPPSDDWEGMTDYRESSFLLYARKKIAIEFKPTIEETCVFRKPPYVHLPGERQIYHSIDISNFDRILVGLVSEEIAEKAVTEISKICGPYQIPVMTFEEAERQKGLIKS